MEDLNLDLLIEDLNLEVVPAENTSFTNFAHQYIRKLSEGKILTPKKRHFSESSVRQYGASMAMFEEFESELPKKVEITDISSKMMKAFEVFLIEKNLSLNSVSAYISKIKAIANVLFDDDMTFRPVRYSTPKERTTKVYLSLSELKQMKECETLSPGQRRVMDIFLIQSFTAMRYSTLKKFLKNPYSFIKESNGNSYIDITPEKTNEQSVIPLSRVVVDILKKHNGKIDPPSERYINQTLKIIGKKAKINTPTPYRITRGGVMVETLVNKYELISSQTARRNLISNAKQTDLSDRVISTISGHSSVSAMEHYCRVENIDKIKDALNHPFFKQKL